MKYTPNEDEAHVAHLIAKRRNSMNRGGTNIPSGEKASCQERLDQHYRAALSEIATARIFNMCWTGCGKGADGLKDVGNLIEVRSIKRRGLGLLARSKDQDNFPCVLVFVNDKSRECTILGWALFEDVKKHGVYRDAKTEKPYWVLPENRLRKLSCLFDLLRKSGWEDIA